MRWIPLRRLTAEFEAAAAELGRQAHREVLAEAKRLAEAETLPLPGNPSQLALVPETVLAPTAFTLDTPVRLRVAEDGTVEVCLRRAAAKGDATLTVEWSQQQNAEVLLRSRDEALRKISFPDHQTEAEQIAADTEREDLPDG